MKNNVQEYNNRVQIAMQAAGLTPFKLAQRYGLKGSNWPMLLDNDEIPDMAIINAIAYSCWVETEWLATGNGNQYRGGTSPWTKNPRDTYRERITKLTNDAVLRNGVLPKDCIEAMKGILETNCEDGWLTEPAAKIASKIAGLPADKKQLSLPKTKGER